MEQIEYYFYRVEQAILELDKEIEKLQARNEKIYKILNGKPKTNKLSRQQSSYERKTKTRRHR